MPLTPMKRNEEKNYKYVLSISQEGRCKTLYRYGTNCANDIFHVIEGRYKIPIPHDPWIYLHKYSKGVYHGIKAAFGRGKFYCKEEFLG